jgi:hypothetical protein
MPRLGHLVRLGLSLHLLCRRFWLLIIFGILVLPSRALSLISFLIHLTLRVLSVAVPIGCCTLARRIPAILLRCLTLGLGLVFVACMRGTSERGACAPFRFRVVWSRCPARQPLGTAVKV